MRYQMSCRSCGSVNHFDTSHLFFFFFLYISHSLWWVLVGWKKPLYWMNWAAVSAILLMTGSAICCILLVSSNSGTDPALESIKSERSERYSSYPSSWTRIFVSFHQGKTTKSYAFQDIESSIPCILWSATFEVNMMAFVSAWKWVCNFYASAEYGVIRL